MTESTQDSEKQYRKYWFAAKEYGYGWGLPLTWQGWVVFIAYVSLVPFGIVWLLVPKHILAFVVYMAVLTGLLCLICWMKGEPLRWRWGERTPGATRIKANPRTWLLLHLFMGPLLLAFALYYRTHLPAEMNSTYGYRTSTSFQNQATWNEAQRYSANLMLFAAVLTLVCQAVTILALKPPFSVATSCAIMLIALITILPITENHLRNFKPVTQGRSDIHLLPP